MATRGFIPFVDPGEWRRASIPDSWPRIGPWCGKDGERRFLGRAPRRCTSAAGTWCRYSPKPCSESCFAGSARCRPRSRVSACTFSHVCPPPFCSRPCRCSRSGCPRGWAGPWTVPCTKNLRNFALFTRKKRTWILSRNTRFCIGEDVSKRTHLRRNYRNKSRRWRVRLISHIWTPIRCRWPAPWRPRNRRNSNPIYPSCSNRSTSISAAAFCKRRFPVKPSAQDKLGERAT